MGNEKLACKRADAQQLEEKDGEEDRYCDVRTVWREIWKDRGTRTKQRQFETVVREPSERKIWK